MIKLITHTDLDGIGCAILAKIAFRNNVEIEYCNNPDRATEALNRFMLEKRQCLEENDCIIPLIDKNTYEQISNKKQFSNSARINCHIMCWIEYKYLTIMQQLCIVLNMGL